MSLLVNAQADSLYTDSVKVYDNNPKREFRGVWVHTIGQSYFSELTSEQVRDTLVKQLDLFQSLGFNVLLFQIRPEGDAFYKSSIEPWSRYLTGEQGKAPDDENFDPMEFLIGECHKRCMEFHAWMNPYRANIDKSRALAPGHIYTDKRYMFVSYGTQLLWNPGVPESREYICNVVKDVVSRYDVDAVHFDDYFYPYPIRGLKFPDDHAFRKYGIPQGYTYAEKDDWRRDNVNKLIHELSDTIHSVKPWVRFGISPFGIYRNKKECAEGSNTNGLTCYGELYADVLLWVKNGWINYCVPQLYWPDGHKNADYTTLIKWWSTHNMAPCKLYIGQDVSRTYQQMNRKMTLSRITPYVDGNCFFSGKMILENMGGIQDSLRAYQGKPALLPEYIDLNMAKPASPVGLKIDSINGVAMLTWESDTLSGHASEQDVVRFYAVYMFAEEDTVNIDNTDALLGLTPDRAYKIPEDALCNQFVVTAVDRMHNESLPSVILFDPELMPLPDVKVVEPAVADSVRVQN